MLNRSGISKSSYTNPKQILANVLLQSSVGCIVPQDAGVEVSGKKIAKAGTPVCVDLMNINNVSKVAAEGFPMNAVLLHDVDVTNGNANGTALVFGFVNVNRLDSDVAAKVNAAKAVSGATNLITFMKV